MTIVQLAPSHAEAAAQLHIAGQPGAFLTSLGPEVLTVLYRALPQSPVGFGYVVLADNFVVTAQSDLASALRTPHSALVLGFVSATTSVGRLFVEMGTRRMMQFLPPLAARFVRQPRLLLRSGQTVLYPLLGHDQQTEARGARAELLSIMVAPAARSQGIGAQLMQALLTECTKRQLQWLDVTVDANNAGARRFYERHGFGLAHTFTLYGRAMCGYQLAITNTDGVSSHKESKHER
ncbi:MAG: GNAT family N-acetyltransferase [Caldilineaceae bacterium]